MDQKNLEGTNVVQDSHPMLNFHVVHYSAHLYYVLSSFLVQLWFNIHTEDLETDLNFVHFC